MRSVRTDGAIGPAGRWEVAKPGLRSRSRASPAVRRVAAQARAFQACRGSAPSWTRGGRRARKACRACGLQVCDNKGPGSERLGLTRWGKRSDRGWARFLPARCVAPCRGLRWLRFIARGLRNGCVARQESNGVLKASWKLGFRIVWRKSTVKSTGFSDCLSPVASIRQLQRSITPTRTKTRTVGQRQGNTSPGRSSVGLPGLADQKQDHNPIAYLYPCTCTPLTDQRSVWLSWPLAFMGAEGATEFARKGAQTPFLP